MRHKKTILTIAGSDPSGGAGIQADLRTFLKFGFSAHSIITAVTAQNEDTFLSVNPVTPKVLRDQLTSVGVCDVVKIGMLATRENVQEVVRYLKKTKPKYVVLDPILSSSTGQVLLEKKAISLLTSELIPLCTLVTPNLSEASLLSGMSVNTIESMKAAAALMMKRSAGVKYVLVKGGHLKRSATDILYDGKSYHLFSGKRFPKSFHGTGCTLSAAIVASLAQGHPLTDSIVRAKNYMSSLLTSRQ